MNIPSLLRAARSSRITRWWLNAALDRAIPFNHPHGFRVVPQKHRGIRVDIPFLPVNCNHIKSLHACCLATAVEYCSGLALIEHLDTENYRIIMKSLRMEYHYQGKTSAYAVFAPSSEDIDRHILQFLRTEESVLYTAEVPIHDRHGNHLATGSVTWQVKDWSKVRTKY